ncbi:MAG: alpha-ketoacid dehydrogenase subunit beta, partial [Actinobacteria bacterium]|nr:alpha-ketoacid dehydrogenase subunit beta [Actinomycetota bacterium]
CTYNRLIILEEDCKTGGVGAEISAQITEKFFDYLDSPIERIAAMDTPIPFNRNLEKIVIPQTDIVIKKIKKIFKKSD